MALFFIRHGETIWNKQMRLQGQLDSPLTLKGTRLAIAYGEALKCQLEGAGEVVIHSSPLGRAWQTAALVAGVLGIDPDTIRIDALLAEHDVGEFEGHLWTEIQAKFDVSPPEFRTWRFQPPGGESRAAMYQRARRWLEKPRGGETPLIVSHGGFSRVLRGAHLGLGPEDTLALPSHDHGRFFRLSKDVVEEIVVDDAARLD
jgi:probable phosphoglycerate mutase